MEVVLPDGELLRTGMGALPRSKSWPEFKMGFGPMTDGLFAQSNFGVVTKMGFWLMPQPEAFLQASVMVPRYDDLHALIEVLNLVENSGLAPGLPQLFSPLLGLGDQRAMVDMFYDGPPKMAGEQRTLIADTKLGFSSALQDYGIRNGTPYWGVKLSFYGPAKVVSAQWEAVQEIASRAVKGASFKADPVRALPIDLEREPAVYAQQVGVPNLEFFAVGSRADGNPNPTSGHMWFSPVIERSGEAIFEANRVWDEASKTVPELNVPILGIKPFALPACLFERSFLFLLGFPVTEDPEQNKAFVTAFRTMIRIGAEHGWGEYRTPAIFQDQVMNVYSFNNNVLRRFHETMKDAVDPKGILSPGRYGIWPKILREKRT